MKDPDLLDKNHVHANQSNSPSHEGKGGTGLPAPNYSVNSGDDATNNGEVVQKHGHGHSHGEELEPAFPESNTNDGLSPIGAPRAPEAGGAGGTTAGGNTAGVGPVANPAVAGELGEPSLMDQIELALFNMGTIWGPQSVVPPTFSGGSGYGGFEASYNRPAKMLNVTVRGKTSFIDTLTENGGTVTSAQEDLDQLANMLNIMGNQALNTNIVSHYTWDSTGKDEAKEQFKNRIAESMGIWENTGLEFYINRPGWEDITANLNVNIDVEEEGNLGDTADREANSQHQQIQIYKAPDGNDFRTVRQEVSSAIRQYEEDNGMSIGRVSSYEVRAYVDGDTDSDDYADDNAHNGSMSLSSRDLVNSQANVDSSHLSSRVWFDNNSSTLSEGYTAKIKRFIGGFKGEGTGNIDDNKITLIGHSSSSGSSDYNEQLSQKRIDSVKTVIQGEGIANFDDRIHESNQGETENGAYEDDDAYFRSVEIKIGSGERQNTVAHEFGHVFGLADEYEEDSRSAGDASGHDGLSQRMGTGRALVENNDGIISTGNEVRAQHYSPFVWTLRELTGKTWLVRDSS